MSRQIIFTNSLPLSRLLKTVCDDVRLVYLRLPEKDMDAFVLVDEATHTRITVRRRVSKGSVSQPNEPVAPDSHEEMGQ